MFARNYTKARNIIPRQGRIIRLFSTPPVCLAALSVMLIASPASHAVGVEVTRLDSPLNHYLSSVEEFKIAQDGSRVVFTGDFDTDGKKDLYVTDVDGTSPPRKLSSEDNSPAGNSQLVLSPDNLWVVYKAVNKAVYSVPLDGSSEPAIVGEAESGSIHVSSDSQWVVTTHTAPSTSYGLFSAPMDGSGAPIRLNATLPSNGAIRDVFISPDSQYVVYQFRAGVLSGPFELYSAIISGSAPSRKLDDGLMINNLGVETRILPDSRRVVYR